MAMYFIGRMTPMKQLISMTIICVLIGSPLLLLAQSPDTEIFLVRITQEEDVWKTESIQNITNRTGYDNQPHFTPDGRAVLYTAILDDGQADTFRYNLSNGKTEQITHTSESEYSPTVMPGGKTFSVIRVEADQSQRLWQFDMDGKSPQIILTDIKPVGYHAWGSENTLSLFVLGDPSTFQIADVPSGKAKIAATNIGRSLYKVPGKEAWSFIQYEADMPSYITILDMKSQKIHCKISMLKGNEYHAWMPDGSAVMGLERKIFIHNQSEKGEWKEVLNLSETLPGSISRMAVHPDGNVLALVITVE